MMRVISPEEELEDRQRSFGLLRPGRMFSAFVRNKTRYFICVEYQGGEDRRWMVIELNAVNRERLAIKGVPYTYAITFDDLSSLQVIGLALRPERPGDLDRSSTQRFDLTYEAFVRDPGNWIDE